MNVKPEYKSFGELFKENNVFFTPKYQRDYSWEDDNIEQFCSDITDALAKKDSGDKYEHFFGGIVCAQSEGVGNRKIENILVDGQQRLSTIILFFSVMRRFIEGLDVHDDDHEFKRQLITDVTNYIVFEERVNRQVNAVRRIKIGDADSRFYDAILDGVEHKPERDSHTLILRAKNRFQDFIFNQLTKSLSIDKKLDLIDEVIKLFDQSFLLIHIITTSVDDAYKLFMVLNDRGISLTEGELLKAHTIGCCEKQRDKKKIAVISKIAADWDHILQYESTTVSNYLRWFIIMFTGRNVTSSSTLQEYKTCYFTDDLSLPEVETRVALLRECVDKLCLISDAEWPFEDTQNTTNWHKGKLDWLIKKLQHAHAMPILLAASFCCEKEFQHIVNEISKFFIRYKVISGLHASIFSSLYPEIAKIIYDNRAVYTVTDLYPKLSDVLEKKDPDNSAFVSGIRSLQYKRKGDNRPIKYLLVYIEENWAWIKDGFKGGLRGRRNKEDKSRVFDFNNTTLEHLYPYSAREVDKDPKLEESKNSIGNLVILDINKNASNADKVFADKKENFKNTGIGIHSIIESKDVWSAEEVNQLTCLYIDFALQVFSFKN